MCNFMKANGEQCKIAPKKDLCGTHLKMQAASVVEPTVEVVEQQAQLARTPAESLPVTIIEEETAPVVETIVEETPVETIAVEETPVQVKPSVVEAVVREFPATAEMEAKCADFLGEYGCKWECEWKLLAEDGKYNHPVNSRDTTVIRVEAGEKPSKYRRFYWIFNRDVATKFALFVGTKLLAEAHEVITRPKIRFFYDIDLQLDGTGQDEFTGFYDTTDYDAISRKLASVYIEAIKISLEDNGIDVDSELNTFDWMFTTRNRAKNGGFKISLHIVTNLSITLAECRALIADIKVNVIKNNLKVLDISDTMADYMCDAIDEHPYRRNASISLPLTTNSKGLTSKIARDYEVPLKSSYFVTHDTYFMADELDMSSYGAGMFEHKNFASIELNGAFIAEALQHAGSIPSIEAFDLKTMRKSHSHLVPVRKMPSFCTMCQKIHDNDSTMQLYFREDYGIASWKCRRVNERPVVFYRRPIDAIKEKIIAENPTVTGKELEKLVERAMTAHEKDLEEFAKKTVISPPDDNLLKAFLKTFESKRLNNKMKTLIESTGIPFYRFKAIMCVDGYEYRTETADWADDHLIIKNHLTTGYQAQFQTFEHISKSLTFESVELMRRFVLFFITELFIFTVSDHKNGFLKTRVEFVSEEVKSTRLFIPFRIEAFQQISLSFVSDNKLKSTKMGNLLTELPFHRFSDIQYIWNHDSTNSNVFSMAQPYVFKQLKQEVDESDLPESLMHYLKDVICNHDENRWEWFRSYLANIIHQPNERTGVMMVLYSSAKRLGKSTLFYLLSRMIFGEHNCVTVNSLSAIFGERGGAHTVGKKLIWLEELCESKKEFRACMERMKSAITDRYQSYRKLYQEFCESINTNEYIASTNNLIGILEDRMTVFDVSDEHRGDTDFYGKLRAEFTQDVANKFCAYLKQFTTSLPMKPLKTNIYGQMSANSRESIVSYIECIKKDQDSNLNVDHRELKKGGGYDYMGQYDLFEHYVKWCDNCKEKPLTQTAFKSKLLHYEPTIEFTKIKENGIRSWVFKFPDNFFNLDDKADDDDDDESEDEEEAKKEAADDEEAATEAPEHTTAKRDQCRKCRRPMGDSTHNKYCNECLRWSM